MKEAHVREASIQHRKESDARAVRSGGNLVLAVLIAVPGILFISFFPHWYEVTIFQNGMPQIIINALAPMVFFLIILLVGAINPFLHRFAPSLTLGGRELFIVATLWLISGVICYTNLTAPALHAIGNAFNPAIEQPMMKRVGLVQNLNSWLFLSSEATKDYYYGTSGGTTRIAFTEIPWQLWLRPLLFWGPFLLVLVVLSMSLVRTVHRQWSRHELLTYPIAEFANSLLARESSKPFPSIFYNRIFWVGFGAISVVYLINGLHLWVPQMIEVPLSFAQNDLIKNFPFLSKYCGREAYSLFRGMLYPFIVCLVVLLPTEVSLTGWLGWVLMILGTGFYFLFTGEVIGQTETTQMQVGMYFAMLVVIVFIGRREYASILRHAFTLRKPQDKVLGEAVVACRVFLAAFLALTALLVVAGLDWFLSLVAVASFSLIVLLAARMTAEIGIPWLVNFSAVASSLPLKLLGAAALGPQGLAVMAVVGAVLGADLSNSIAAQETTIGKLSEAHQGKSGRNGLRLLLLVGIAVALGATIVSTLWDNYSFGSRLEKGMNAGLRGNMDTASVEINRLQIEGKTGELSGVGGLAKLAHVKSEPNFWRFFLYGTVIVGVCAFMRLRFTWWPFHPLPLLLIGTWCLSRLYFSILIGWLIKVALVKIGGGKVFSHSKPFFIGVIVGQIVVAALWIIVGVIYYLRTGTQPPQLTFFL